MKYKNIRTGAVIETSSQICGGEWKEIVVKKTETGTEKVAESGEKTAPAKVVPKASTTKTEVKRKAAVKK